MGRFVKLVVPLNMDYIDRIYVFDDELVPLTHVAKMLGYQNFGGNSFVAKYTVVKGARHVLDQRKPVCHFIHLADIPKIMDFFGWDEPDFWQLGVKPQLPGKVLQESVEFDRESAESKKRDREFAESGGKDRDPVDHDLFIREFAKRYIAEHPDQAKKIIMDSIVDQIFGKVNGSLF